MQARSDLHLAIKCSNAEDCKAGAVCILSPGTVCSFIFNFSHAFLASYASLTCGAVTMRSQRAWALFCPTKLHQAMNAWPILCGMFCFIFAK